MNDEKKQQFTLPVAIVDPYHQACAMMVFE
jgi:hypothetical protein